MAGYTNLEFKIANAILSLYGEEQAIDILAMTHGISNSNFKVTTHTGKNFLLKISNDKDLSALAAEQNLLTWLKKQDYHYCVEPLQTKSGSLVYEIENYFGVLFPFVNGETPQISHDVCEQLGIALAELHTLKPGPLVRAYSDVGQDFHNITAYLKSSHVDPAFAEISHSLLESFDWSDFQQRNLPEGFLHGDLYYDNTLFENDQLKYVLDFEQSGVGPLLFDIGVSISGSCLTECQEIDHKLLSSFMKGYESIRTLSSVEIKNLNQAIILGLLSVSLWRIIRFNQKQIAHGKQESYKELLSRAVKFHKGLTCQQN